MNKYDYYSKLTRYLNLVKNLYDSILSDKIQVSFYFLEIQSEDFNYKINRNS
jgi:hypothetical protein